jgi:hypothetical protein
VPVESRQLLGSLGSTQCNLARLRIVGALTRSGQSIDAIQDETVKTAASTGLDQANLGVSQIAQAILTGEAPPQESRDIVAAGLAAMGTALIANRYAWNSVCDVQPANGV